jgi:ribonuclease D
MRYRDDAISVEWISDNQALQNACGRIGSVLALDTEFMRTNTYYPIPGLYQIGIDDVVFLVDPRMITEWQPLRDVFEDPSIVKIMHACLEDLELLYHHFGTRLQQVFDTQYANAFVTDRFSLSYAGLVEERLGVSLSKHETRSDWLQRPLSDEQIEYAVEDVIYLPALYETLKSELTDTGRMSWFSDDMAERQRYDPINPAEYYRNLKRGWQLSEAQLAIFQSLCQWRERTAQSENVPRNRVVWDEHLFNFARLEQLEEADVRAALPGSVARKYAQPLVAASRAATELSIQPLPMPLTSAQGIVVKALRSVGLEKATSLEMAPELICRKRDLEECVRVHAKEGQLSKTYSTWRIEVVGADYLSILNTSPA